jgi:hypothetical protein
MSNANTSEPASAVPALPKPAWRLNLVLFLITLSAVFVTGLYGYKSESESLGLGMSASSYRSAFQFVGTVMTILVAHELGHYITARIHRVDASLPYFLPLPIISPFGTMGAVIRMRGKIATRPALLDIGASGPLAGMFFAVPLYIWGVAHSTVIPEPTSSGEAINLGESVIVRVLDHFFAPHLADGMTVLYSPIAFGAWGGMFVTMINLLPVGQLDGGHIAYSLFGPRQDRFAVTIQRSMLVFFVVAVIGHLMRDMASGRAITTKLFATHVGGAAFWLVWSQVLAILGTLSRPADAEDEENAVRIGWRTRIFAALGLVVTASVARAEDVGHGTSLLCCIGFVVGFALLIAMEIKSGVFRKHELFVHPPTGAEPLGSGRKAVAIFTLVLFALLFMPEPFSF